MKLMCKEMNVENVVKGAKREKGGGGGSSIFWGGRLQWQVRHLLWGVRPRWFPITSSN